MFGLLVIRFGRRPSSGLAAAAVALAAGFSTASPATLCSGLADSTISHLRQLSAELKAGKRVLFLTGAGLSEASGIPCYRGAPEAVWSRFVTEWGTRQKFRSDPLLWYNKFWLPVHAAAVESVQGGAPGKGAGA
eukprot:RCo014080